jgi:transcriptional regulator
MLTFGKKISMLRKEKGWFQTEIAKILNTSKDEIKNRRTYAVK